MRVPLQKALESSFPPQILTLSLQGPSQATHCHPHSPSDPPKKVNLKPQRHERDPRFRIFPNRTLAFLATAAVAVHVSWPPDKPQSLSLSLSLSLAH